MDAGDPNVVIPKPRRGLLDIAARESKHRTTDEKALEKVSDTATPQAPPSASLPERRNHDVQALSTEKDEKDTYRRPFVDEVRGKCKELPPFGVPEILIGICGCLAVATSVVSAQGFLRDEDKDQTAYPFALLAFFTAFGLRSQIPAMIIQGSLVIFAVLLLTSSAHLGSVFGVYQKLAGGLILCGLSLGWLAKILVLGGHHCCRPKGLSYNELISSERGRAERKENVEVIHRLVHSANDQFDRATAHRQNYHVNGRYWQAGVQRRELGVINSGLGRGYLCYRGRFFPPFRCWEALTGAMIAAGIAVAIVELSRDHTSDFNSVGLIIGNYCSLLLSVSRFDGKCLFWTVLLVAIILCQLIIESTLVASGKRSAKQLAPSIGLFVLGFLWILRGISEIWRKYTKTFDHSTHKRALHEVLMKRGFQTGDLLITGSVGSLADYVARIFTHAAWGHVAIVVKHSNARIRTLFAVGNWLQRMPRRMKRWMQEEHGFFGSEDLTKLAPILMEHITDQQMHNETKQRVALVNMAIVLRRLVRVNSSSADKDNNVNGKEKGEQKWASSSQEREGGAQENGGEEKQNDDVLPDHVLQHCTRFPCKVKRSKDDLYAVEAVGTGSRMVTLETFMDFWYNKRSEFVAWRPLYKRYLRHKRSTETGSKDTIKLDYESAKIVAGRPYVCSTQTDCLLMKLNTNTNTNTNTHTHTHTQQRRISISSAAQERHRCLPLRS